VKKALIISFSNLTHDARVQRQVRFLQKHFKTSVVCYAGSRVDGAELIPVLKPTLTHPLRLLLSVLLIFRRYHRAYWMLYGYGRLVNELKPRSFDLIVANDVESLPLAFAIKNKSKVWIDAHEFAPRHFEEKLYWRVFFQGFNKYLCRTYLRQGDWMTTVSTGLQRAYAEDYSVTPVVISNATRYFELTPGPTDPQKIRIVHHGGANPSRNLELLIDMMAHLDDRFTLDLMLITPALSNTKTGNYLDLLKSRARNNPRITFHPPVGSDQIVPFIHQFDIGIFLLPPVNFNYANTLPNKLFDFIQARLAIAIGPTPEMKQVVTTYNLGVVAPSFEPKEMATLLNALSPADLTAFKQNAHRAARALSAEQNETLIKDALASLSLIN